MDIIQECLAYFKNIDINFDLLIIADTQNKLQRTITILFILMKVSFFLEKNLLKSLRHYFIFLVMPKFFTQNWIS